MSKRGIVEVSDQQMNRLDAASSKVKDTTYRQEKRHFYHAMLCSLSGRVSDKDWDRAIAFAVGLWVESETAESTKVGGAA